jgi:peptidoglycan/LPS O-acetylase OafA/YrhL
MFGPTIKYLELRSGLDANYSGLYVSAEQQASFVEIIPSGLPVAAPFDEGYFEFLPTFFTQLDRFTWAHLWFLAYLFTFSLLYQPLFAWLRGRREGLRLGAGWVYLPVLPLALIQITLRARWPGLQNLYDDWANFAYYSTFLCLGFLLARNPAFEEALHREWKRALVIALASMGVLLASVLGWITSPTLLLGGTALAGWCFIVAILGFARARLARPSPALGYLTESAYPVYLLHQIAIVGIGYWLVQLPLGGGFGIALEFALLLAAATAATVGIYHFVVRPVPLLRFLHGMRPRSRAVPAERAGERERVALVEG